MSKNKKLADKLASADGDLQSITTQSLYLLGDKIAKKEGYKSLSGIEAVHYYLMQKHHWLPSQVKSMSYTDLSFCFEEEKI